MAGRVELLVSQHQKIETGMPIYRIDSPALARVAGSDRHGGGRRRAGRRTTGLDAPARESHRLRGRTNDGGRDAPERRMAGRLEELQDQRGGHPQGLGRGEGVLTGSVQAELAEVSQLRVELDAREPGTPGRKFAPLAPRVNLLVNSAVSLTGIDEPPCVRLFGPTDWMAPVAHNVEH